MHSLSNDPLEDPFRADLHCHSTCSDGSMTPEELIDLALQEGVSALSITDHDTIDAYITAIPYARKKGLILGSGVEFSCHHRKQSVHVLAYDFPLTDPGIIGYCKRQQEKRLVRNKEILEKLQRLRIIINESDLIAIHPKLSTIGRPHIAEVMVQKGHVKTIQEAFQLYIGERGCCFTSGEAFPVKEAVSVIHEAGGKVFLAHPHIFNDATIIREVLAMGFDGMECYYGRSPHYKGSNWLKMAKQKELLVSGGSDFHGTAKPHIPLGCSFVRRDLFSLIFEKNLLS